MLIDYSTLRPPIPLLKAAGVTAVGRYLGRDCEPGYNCIRKNLTPAEKDALLAAGIQIWLSSEYAADAALGGARDGTIDGQLASRQLHDLAMAAPGTAVYYAVDFDVPDYAPTLPEGPQHARAKLGPVADYFDAIHATKPNHEVDGYGGFWAVSRLLDAGLIRRGWQTLAWSAGIAVPHGATHCVVEGGFLRDTRASLLQLIKQVLGAADVDNIPGVQHAPNPDFGQWPRPKPPSPDEPPGWQDQALLEVGGAQAALTSLAALIRANTP